jgi:hypothetical protein
MLRKQIAIAALILGASGTASAYEIGRLTCQNVGQLAAQMLMARQSGIPPQAYLSALNEKLPPDANVERALVVQIAEVVFQNEEIAQMKPEQAYLIFAQNCVQGQEQDQTSSQRDEASPDEDDNESMDEDGPDEKI